MKYAKNLIRDTIRSLLRDVVVCDSHERYEPNMCGSWIAEGVGGDRTSMYHHGHFNIGIFIADTTTTQTHKPKSEELAMYEPIQENVRELSVVLTQEAFPLFQTLMEKAGNPDEPRSTDLWVNRVGKSPNLISSEFVTITWRNLEMSKLHPAIAHLYKAIDAIEKKHPHSCCVMGILESCKGIGVQNHMGRNAEVNRLLAQKLAISLHPDRKYARCVNAWFGFRNEQEAKEMLHGYTATCMVAEQRIDLAKWWEDGPTIHVEGGFVKMLVVPTSADQLDTVTGFGKWLVRGDGPDVPFYYLDPMCEHGCLQLSPYNISKAIDLVLEKHEDTEKAKETTTTLNNICLIGPGNLKGTLVALRRRCFDDNTMPSEKIVDFLTKASLTFAGGSQMLVWSDVSIADDDILEQFLNVALSYLERKEPGNYQYVRVNKSSKCVHQLGATQSQFSASVHNFMKDFYTSL